MPPIRKGDGTGLAPKGFAEVRKGDGTVLWSANTAPESGVARYEFEQDATDSWDGYDGTNQGGSYTTTAKVGDYAIDLDGVDDYVEIPDFGLFDGSEDYSVALWFRADNLSSFGRIFHPRAEADVAFVVDRVGNSELAYYTYDGDEHNVSTSSLSTETWYHTVATWDADGDVTLYLDGSSVDSGSLADPEAKSGTNAFGARISTQQGDYYDGIIDDPRIYDKVLSDIEVSNLYNTGSI